MPTANAIRLKRRRARFKAGKIVLPVAVDEVELIEFLIEGGWLAPNQQDDRRALATASERFLNFCLERNAR
jgi:hypothetical protein